MVNAHLLLAPVGAGKTEFVLSEVHRQFAQNPFARLWVLLATQRQEIALRERLFAHGGRDTYFNIEFFNFSDLYQRILDMAGEPQRLLNPTEQRLILRHVIHTTPLTVFAPVAHTNGFVHIIEDWIRELKQNRVFPEAYASVAQNRREHDLSRLYSAYQQALIRYNLMDDEGQGWLAVEALEQSPSLISQAGVDMLIVDGFDQFSHTQSDLLARLSQQIPQTVITLTQVTNREATIGRRFATAKAELKRAFNRAGAILTTSPIGASPTSKHPDLAHLIHNIFLQNSPKQMINGGITFLEAPTPTEETALALRHVKALLLDGAKPDDILIAVRDWANYRKPLKAYADKYGLPLVLHDDEPLSETPFVMTLTALLNLAKDDFPRRGVLDALRSPYINGAGLSSEWIDTLEAISNHQMVLGGREAWLKAIYNAVHHPTEDATLSDDEALPAYTIDSADADYLHHHLSAFFDAITPPPTATLTEFIAWIEGIIGADNLPDADDDTDIIPDDTAQLNMVAQARLGDETWLARDLLVISAIKHGLQDLLFAHHKMSHIIETTSEMRWDEFYDQLMDSLARRVSAPRPSRRGRILATTAVGGRGLPHAHVVILGLSEGIFPAPIPQDPLYLESERIRLNLALPDNPIKTQAEARDDEGVFYELICLPTQSLILTRPTLKDGKEWLPSPLWRGATALYTNAQAHIQAHKIGIGKMVDMARAATVDEAFSALAIGLNSGDESLLSMGAWLVGEYPHLWHKLKHSRHIEQGRSQKEANRYNGVLEDDALKTHISHYLDTHYVWSATRLNDQGVCGFRFFAKHLLKLEERQEPQAGMDVLQRGSLYHAILEAVYSELKNLGMSISPNTLPTAQALLDHLGTQILHDAPQQFGFIPTPLWEEEKRNIMQKLRRFIEADFAPEKDVFTKTFGLSGERKPYRLEARFGFDDHPFWLDLGDDIGAIRVRGIIDRIDKIGAQLVVMDYKSGSNEIKPSEIEDGRNYQMLIYLYAVRHIASHTPLAGGFFWHLGDMRPKGVVKMNDDTHIMQKGMMHLAHQIGASRAGNFAVDPNKPPTGGMCTPYCEFSKLCRHARTTDEDDA
ncbi:MAG: hypothetical protein CUN52_03355 [Phototrophicales bacterium]|jgi:ATP-dependent helicase/DNAse subunit B|nr:MAG: hypothetical protein CUN52_03355 [Phototrophicales bacterium]